MTIEEQINKMYFQETEFALKNIDECQCFSDKTKNINDILSKCGIEDEDIAFDIDCLTRIASSFFTIGTLYFIDKLRKG